MVERTYREEFLWTATGLVIDEVVGREGCASSNKRRKRTRRTGRQSKADGLCCDQTWTTTVRSTDWGAGMGLGVGWASGACNRLRTGRGQDYKHVCMCVCTYILTYTHRIEDSLARPACSCRDRDQG